MLGPSAQHFYSAPVRYAEIKCDTSFSSVNWQEQACSVSNVLSGLPQNNFDLTALYSPASGSSMEKGTRGWTTCDKRN